MYKDKKILGLITARGGSTSIPKKNIALLAGKPLIWYTINSAQKSRHLTRTIVSTDDDEIMSVAKQYGIEAPFKRPAELAQEDTRHMPVIQHALQWLRDNKGEEYDYVLVLLPTAPLRTAADIDAAIVKAVDTEADSVMSMVEIIDFDARKIKKIENDLILPMFAEEGKESARRQSGIRAYKRNCAIYLTKTELIRQGDLFGKTSRAYIMPPERSVDINEPFDLQLAEFLLSRHSL